MSRTTCRVLKNLSSKFFIAGKDLFCHRLKRRNVLVSSPQADVTKRSEVLGLFICIEILIFNRRRTAAYAEIGAE